MGNTNDAIFEELIDKGVVQDAGLALGRTDVAYRGNTNCDECVHKSVSGMLAKRSQKKGTPVRFVGSKVEVTAF